MVFHNFNDYRKYILTKKKKKTGSANSGNTLRTFLSSTKTSNYPVFKTYREILQPFSNITFHNAKTTEVRTIYDTLFT